MLLGFASGETLHSCVSYIWLGTLVTLSWLDGLLQPVCCREHTSEVAEPAPELEEASHFGRAFSLRVV